MSGEMRIPPNSAEAEVGVLGCLMLAPLETESAMLHEYEIGPEAFYNPVHQEIADTVLKMIAAGGHVDLLTVAQKLRDAGRLETLGGEAYLMHVVDKTPSATGAAAYCQIVKQKWVARQTIDIARAIEAEAYTSEEPDKLLAEAPERFTKIGRAEKTAEATDEQLMDTWIEACVDARKHQKPAIDLHLPLPYVTEKLQGLELGVTILAARPSCGKTTMEIGMRTHLCEQGIPVGVVTADSNRDKLLRRQMCMLAGVSMAKAKYGYANNAQIDAMHEAKRRIAKYPQFFNDHVLEVLQICSWARAMKRKHGIRLLTIDYIQQLRASHLGGWAATDSVRVVTEISSRLKALSYELGIPVLVLSQLNRALEKDGRSPMLSDLRDSGGLEQDAEKVAFLWIDKKKKQAMEEAEFGATKHKRPVWFGIMKNKDGELSDIPMWMYPPYFRFEPAVLPTPQTRATWEPFGDDALPSARHADNGDFSKYPELIPQDVTDADADLPEDGTYDPDA